MTHPLNAPRHAHADRSAPMSIDWEELPSLSDRVTPVGSSARPGPVWEETMPSGLDVLGPPSKFCEPLPGLDIREVSEPDLFRHFFDHRPSATVVTETRNPNRG